MVSLTESVDETSSSEESSDAFVMRVATVYLTVAHDQDDDGGSLASKLAKALESDPRVRRTYVPSMDQEWSPAYAVYWPTKAWDDEHGVLEGTRHTHVQRMSDPVEFWVEVPAKNQPKVYESDDIPSERYLCWWNGVVLLVGWQQPASDPVGSSGGHVVEQILEDATERIDAGVFVQACNPQCEYVFLHTAIRTKYDPGVTGWTVRNDLDDPYLLDVTIPLDPEEPADLDGAMLQIWYRIQGSVEPFAELKNSGRRVLELERFVRRDLDRLNRLHHGRASAAQGTVGERVKALWEYRSWRRTSRFYLARLWLGLGTLERLKRDWSDARLGFTKASRQEGIEALFVVDTFDEVSLVEQLDLQLIESAIEHAGDRLSSSALAFATVGGALAGAIVAAIISAA